MEKAQTNWELYTYFDEKYYKKYQGTHPRLSLGDCYLFNSGTGSDGVYFKKIIDDATNNYEFINIKNAPPMNKTIKNFYGLYFGDFIVYYDILGREVCRKEEIYYYDTRYYENGLPAKTSFPYSTMPTLDTQKIWSEFTYNNFNELIEQIDAKNDTTTYQYDKLGRIIKKQFSDTAGNTQTIDYIYDLSNNGKGKLHQIKMDGDTAETFTYDTLSRLIKHTKIIDSIPFTFSYTYNVNGQLKTLTYPDDFSITYGYSHVTGKLATIKDNDNKKIFTVHSQNRFGKVSRCIFGNMLAASFEYDNYGSLTRLKAGNIIPFSNEPYVDDDMLIGEEIMVLGGGEQDSILAGPFRFSVDGSVLDYTYIYNNCGLMTSRTESVALQTETYTYDVVDRLITNSYNQNTQIFAYHDNGNMLSNSNVGTYSYSSPKPNAVTKIQPGTDAITDKLCGVTYNFFNQPTEITEGTHRITLDYGADQQRNKMLKYNQYGYVDTMRYYINKYYEIEINPRYATHHYHYIYGDEGAVALHISHITSDRYVSDSLYFIHTDHVGSYCALTNTVKQVRQRNRFGPFGDCGGAIYAPIGEINKDGDTLRGNALEFPITRRGFTGHEHYPWFKIINMNGRLYDPVIARFFSPDNFVQMPEFTQGFNRYSYCLNNPLKYTDPTGERFRDVDDWYLNLESGRVEYHEGDKNRFREGLIHLAGDRATVGDIANALTKMNYDFIKDASVDGGFWVDTEKQYKGWMMMNIFSPDNVGSIFGIAGFESNIASKGATNVAKNSATLLNEVQVTAKGEMQGLRSLTSSNFRFNLGKLTGEIPANSQAHHVFPQKFATRFADKGIHIHHPKFGTWWETTNHLQNAKAYNAAWESFFSTSPTQSQILNQGRSMLQLYGLPVGF